MSDDFSELMELAADLRGAGDEVGQFADKAIKVTAGKIKRDWRKGADRTGLHKYARDIDYDVTYGRGEIVAEIGPTIGDSGSFGLVEDAPGGVLSAPQHAGRSALEANEADFVDGMEKAIFDATKKAVQK